MALTGRSTRAGIVKAGGADNWVSGIDTATEMIAFLQHIGSDIAGCVLEAKRREGGGNNSRVLGYLADGGRDISPTDADKRAAEETIRTLIVAKLRMMTKRGNKRLKRWDEERAAKFRANGRIEANKIASLALRKAGRQMQEAMRERVENPSGYDPVSEPYATRRLAKYSVPKTAIFRATGQLVSNIASGHVRLIRKKDLLARIGGALSELGEQAGDMIL